VPREHRTDRLSAAYRNLSSQEDGAARYAEFCSHYGMEPTRNNAGVSHENGSVEAVHGHLKGGLAEALELRGSHDFPDLAAYQAFLQEFIARKNAPRRAVLAVELAALLPLPRHRTTDFSTATVTVTRSATISVRTVLYTVPSRLIGCPRKACRVYVGLLHLAAMHGCEAALAEHLAAVLDVGGTPDLEAARAAVAPPALASAPAVSVPAPDLAGYDRLLTHLGEAA
jgi:hypothetical protein